MGTLTSKLRRERTNAAHKVALQTFNAPATYPMQYGKVHVLISGRGATGNAPIPGGPVGVNPAQPGNYAGTNPPVSVASPANPPTPGNYAGTNPTVAGNYAYTNPTTPGTYAGTNPTTYNVTGYNPAPNGFEEQITQQDTYSGPAYSNDGIYTVYPGTNTTYNTQEVFGNTQPADSYYVFSPDGYFDGNSRTTSVYTHYVLNMLGAGSANYAATPGNPYYNAPVPGNAVYNPPTPGNSYYNPPTPGYTNYAGTNPPTGGTYAGTYASTPGNYAGTNPPTGGTYAGVNAPTGGTYAGTNPTTTNIAGYNQGYTYEMATRYFAYYDATNAMPANGTSYAYAYHAGNYLDAPYTAYPTDDANASPMTLYVTYAIASQVPSNANYAATPGNPYYNTATPGNPYYNPTTPGNAYYNPPTAGTAYYNPPVPGNAYYNGTVPGNPIYNPATPGNVNYAPPTPGNPGAAVNVLGVTFPGGPPAALGSVITETMVKVPYQPGGLQIPVPPGGYVTIKEL